MQDTIHFFARGIEGTILPKISIPISYSILVSVERDYDEKTPLEFQLGQNYPNPFNAQTKIQFRLSKSGPTTLKILNLKGQEVIQIMEQHLEAGKHEFLFAAQSLPSGLYFYRLESGGHATTKKLILLR